MKTSLDYLPERKRVQLRDIAALFREGAIVEMLILFGSHARGDWVQDPETGYRSDFDLLAIVETEKHAVDLSLWHELERRARKATGHRRGRGARVGQVEGSFCSAPASGAQRSHGESGRRRLVPTSGDPG